MTTSLTELFGEVIHAYTAEQSVADGVNIRPNPATAKEAGFNIPVVLTQAAFDEAIEWTRPGEESFQSEDARFWDVLNTVRAAAKASFESGSAHKFDVYRVPNKTKTGNFSRASTASRLILSVHIEGYDLNGQPCVMISLPGED